MTGSLPGGGAVALHGRWITGPQEAPPGQLLVLGFTGDLGFSGKDQPLSAAGAVRHGRIIPWDELFSGAAPLLEADATFANLETVITDRPDLLSVDKSFNFAASSAGLKAAVRAGINVIAAANNHAADYGEGGIAETLRNLAAAGALGLKGHAGLGQGDERYRAAVFDLHGASIGMSAVGKGINPGGPQGYGQPLYASQSDFDRASRSLDATRADVRVLSVHYGEELNLLPSVADRKRLRSAIDRGDATIVFGHHSHVASGVERRGNGLIFFGLGNFMHAGTQDMTRYGRCRDFGLHVRVSLWVTPGSKPVLRAVEITPMRDMHEIAKPFPAGEAAMRIAVVNAMSEELNRDGGDPLLFMPTDRGSGLACFPGSVIYSDELEARCRAQASPLMNVASVTRASLASCKPLPRVELATGRQKVRPELKTAEDRSSKPEKAGRQTSTKRGGTKVSADRKSGTKKPKRLFLFSKTE
jgi:poly-gamma-glutamate capsule biosynthesis protein CapA/YwtB (metallophosphatase superfamily)